MAFSSNGIFHKSSLVFIDWFLCRASREHVKGPPAHEKLRVLHAMSAAVVDQTATILTIHFSRFLNDLHAKVFPHVLAQGPGVTAPLRHRSRIRRSTLTGGTLQADAMLDSLSQHSSSAALTPALSQVSAPSLPVLTPSVRQSERLRMKFTNRGTAVELGV